MYIQLSEFIFILYQYPKHSNGDHQTFRDNQFVTNLTTFR